MDSKMIKKVLCTSLIILSLCPAAFAKKKKKVQIIDLPLPTTENAQDATSEANQIRQPFSWEQVAATFNNEYDEHLIFELLNEPRLVGHEREWWYDAGHPDCAKAQGIVIELEEACIKAIRASGGKNADRFLMIPGYVAQPWAAMADTFHLPADSAKNRAIISVHMYDPWPFAGENPGISEFTQEARDGLKGTFEALNGKFVKNGVPVVIGECGATNKNNLPEREAWYRYYFETSKKNGITAILWDNGSTEIPENGDVSEHFGFYDRTAHTFFFPTLLNAALDGIKAAGKN